MSVKIYETKAGEAFFCESCTDWVFGPLMADYEEAAGFLYWLKDKGVDPRIPTDSEMEKLYTDFRYREKEV